MRRVVPRVEAHAAARVDLDDRDAGVADAREGAQTLRADPEDLRDVALDRSAVRDDEDRIARHGRRDAEDDALDAGRELGIRLAAASADVEARGPRGPFVAVHGGDLVVALAGPRAHVDLAELRIDARGDAAGLA